MNIDLEDFGFEEQEATEEATEQQEQEPVTPEKEETKQEEKPAAPKVDHVDRSKPLEERLKQERDNMKFATGLMGDYQRTSALTLCCHLLDVLNDPNEKQRATEIRIKFDENKWTFPELYLALSERFRKELGNNFGAVGGEIVLSWIHEIIVTMKPEDRRKKPETTATKPAQTPKAEAKKEPKPAPKKDHEQLELDLGEF